MNNGKTKIVEYFKRLYSGLNSLMLILILIAILIAANLIANKLPWKYDMTVDRIFTLSDQTREVINQLDKNINITAFYKEGEENPTVQALLEEYVKAGGGKIKVEYTDAERNPIAAKRLDVNNEGILNDNIIFECEGKIKKVNKSDIFSLNSAYGKSFSGEQQFTGAILHITSSKLTKVYFLEGHQETGLDVELFRLKNQIENEACTAESVNLVKAGGVPDDADVLVVVSPKRDLSSEEKAMLKQYLFRGGRMILLLDVLGDQTKLSNFGELLNSYGIGITNNFVVEEDQNYYYTNNNMYLVPDYTDQSIVKSIKAENLAIIFPYSMNLELIQTDDKNLIIEPVLRTSDNSWSRYNIMDATPAMTDDDVQGPANVAVAVERDNSDDRQKNTKIFIAGNAKFIDNNMLEIQGNADLFMNAVNWVRDKNEAISIRSKMLNSNQMMVRGPTFNALLVVSVLIIPMLVFGTGFVIWLRRRHA
jgi:ABC-2 type transport system permease protein